MAKYDIIEMPQMNKSDEQVLYPKLKHIRLMNSEEFIQKIADEPGGPAIATIENVYAATVDMLARYLSEGYSVRLKGIGTFTAGLGMKKGKENETDDEKRNARSIEIDKINIVADKQLVKKTNKSCHLERGDLKHINRVATTEDERLAMALRFLDTHPFMTLSDYVALTGLTRTKASIELKKFRAAEGSGITSQGQRSYLVYVKE